jgi:hypothetical protein
MATLPPSLSKLLRIATDHGTYDQVDPAADPAGYRQLLTDSASRRERLDQTQDDAANDAMGDVGVKSRLMGQLPRMQANNAAQGFNAQWQPFLEAFNVLGDNNPGKAIKTQTRSTAGLPLAPSPQAPLSPPLELDPELPPLPDAFTQQQAPRSPTGFPNLARRTTAAPSMRALAKQGGY